MSKMTHGFIITINSGMLLYLKHIIHIDDFPLNGHPPSVYYVTMQITLPISEFTRNERNLHCDVLLITTDRVARLVLDDSIAAIQTSLYRPIVVFSALRRMATKSC